MNIQNYSRKVLYFFIALVFSLMAFTTQAQEEYSGPNMQKMNFNEAAFSDDSPATIYFVRVTGFGYAVSFEFFHNDKYIGAFKGKNYMKYECLPGVQLLWASSENKEFVTADLEPGGIYIVIVDVIMGGWKARVGLSPISENDKKLYEKAKKLILKEDPVITPQKKIDKMNIKLDQFIDEKLNLYETDWKNSKNFRHISADMEITDPDLKK